MCHITFLDQNFMRNPKIEEKYKIFTSQRGVRQFSDRRFGAILVDQEI